MTASEERALLKNFEMRRAGLSDVDERADDELLDLLRVIGRDPAGKILPARRLTDNEKKLCRLGKLANQVKGDIMTQAAAGALEQQRLGQVRAEAMTKARRAEAEAKRLTAEAQRLRGGG